MKNRRIYIRAGMLDRNHFKTSVDQSRAKYLGQVMDDAEWQEQLDYDSSSDRYNRTSFIQKYGGKLSNLFINGIAEINNDVRDIIEEYDLVDKNIWAYISDELIAVNINETREDGLTTKIYESQGCLNFVIKSTGRKTISGYSGGREIIIARVGVIETEEGYNYGGGNPDAAELVVDDLNISKFCDAILDTFNGFDEEEIYNIASDYINFLLEDIIARQVTRGVDYCIEQNPSPLE